MARVDRFQFERALSTQGCVDIAGVDEVGRGPLAGPVVAAAVILPALWIQDGLPSELDGLNDSKQLNESQRERFYTFLVEHPSVLHGLAQLDATEIDRINILKATHAAMAAALRSLFRQPQHVLVDGLEVKSLQYPQTPLVKGDGRSFSIAAASVIAKVTRDRLMKEFDQAWPQYGFAAHKGYPTEIHLRAIAEHGPCPIHRRSFAPLKARQVELW